MVSNKKLKEKHSERKISKKEADKMENERMNFKNLVMEYSNGKSYLKEIIEEQNKLISYKTPLLDSSHLYIPREKGDFNMNQQNGPIFNRPAYNITSASGFASP